LIEVRAEMTASVWQVSRAVGDSVAAGDTILILESMKMEIPVEAPVAGTIVQIAVNAGDNVRTGDRLAEIR